MLTSTYNLLGGTVMKDDDKKDESSKEKTVGERKSTSEPAPFPILNPDPEYVKGLARGGYNHAKA
jgi:hypothetical protein